MGKVNWWRGIWKRGVGGNLGYFVIWNGTVARRRGIRGFAKMSSTRNGVGWPLAVKSCVIQVVLYWFKV